MREEIPQFWVIAGPNGAGKTTLVSGRVADRIPVVNPDEIAARLPLIDGRLDERQAGTLALRRRADLLADRASFAVETTLTGASTLNLMRSARRSGYKITLIYVGLSDPDLSLQRISDRMDVGGHAVPVSAALRRYPASLAALTGAIEIANRTFILDNSGRRRRLLVVKEAGRIRFVARDLPDWIPPGLLDAD